MMRNKVAQFLVIITVALAITPRLSDAQADKPKCDPAAVIKKASALKSSGDVKKDMDALVKLQIDIATANIACNGMTFEGKGAKIIGPFDIPKGDYRVTLKTNGFFSANLKVRDGTCEGGTFGLLFNIFSGGANSGTEALITSEGCKAIIETSNVTESWKLTIEPIG
jgi:hypothetical protein